MHAWMLECKARECWILKQMKLSIIKLITNKVQMDKWLQELQVSVKVTKTCSYIPTSFILSVWGTMSTLMKTSTITWVSMEAWAEVQMRIQAAVLCRTSHLKSIISHSTILWLTKWAKLRKQGYLNTKTTFKENQCWLIIHRLL
jgi:hypothetical protein